LRFASMRIIFCMPGFTSTKKFSSIGSVSSLRWSFSSTKGVLLSNFSERDCNKPLSIKRFSDDDGR
jgi:hypothetical protein